MPDLTVFWGRKEGWRGGKREGEREGRDQCSLQSNHIREGGTVDKGELSADQTEHKESTPRSNQPSLVSRVTAQVTVQKLYLNGQLLEESIAGRPTSGSSQSLRYANE